MLRGFFLYFFFFFKSFSIWWRTEQPLKMCWRCHETWWRSVGTKYVYSINQQHEMDAVQGRSLGRLPPSTQPKRLHNVGENLNKSTSERAFSPLKRLVCYSGPNSYPFVAHNFFQCAPQVRHSDWSHSLHLHIEPLQSSVRRSECHHIVPAVVTVCPEHRHNKRHYDSLRSPYLQIKLHRNVTEFYFSDPIHFTCVAHLKNNKVPKW